jgi:hypothetical protein
MKAPGMNALTQKMTPWLISFYSVVGIGVVAGTAWLLLQPDDAPVAPAATSDAPIQGDSRAALKGYADLWSKGGPNQMPLPEKSATRPGTSDKKAELEAQHALRQNALANPAALRVLMHRYETEKDPRNRDMIKSVLSSIKSPEVIDFSKRLAISGDAGQRKDGLEIIQRMSIDSADVRAVVKQEIATEQSPAVLVQALNALQPSSEESSDAHEVVSQLGKLLDNADSSVRKQSILRLSQWDTTGESADRLAQLSNDQDPEVKKAAAHALAQIKANIATRKMLQSGGVN